MADQEDVSVFGRPASKEIADKILSSSVLNGVPSPEKSATMPANALRMGYLRLLSACYEIEKAETDKMRQLEVQKCKEFADRVLRETQAYVIDEPGTPAAQPPPGAQPLAVGASQGPSPGPLNGMAGAVLGQ